MVHDCWALTTKQNIFHNYDACCSCSFVHSSESNKVLKPTWTWMCNLFASCPSSESAFLKSVSKNCWILLISFNGIKVQKAFWKNTIFHAYFEYPFNTYHIFSVMSRRLRLSKTLSDQLENLIHLSPMEGEKKWFSFFFLTFLWNCVSRWDGTMCLQQNIWFLVR